MLRVILPLLKVQYVVRGTSDMRIIVAVQLHALHRLLHQHLLVETPMEIVLVTKIAKVYILVSYF